MTDYQGWIAEVNSLSLQDVIDTLKPDPRRGAITTFTGITRADSDHEEHTVKHIEIEAWEGKSSEAMNQIADEIGKEFNLLGLRIVHLEGIIPVGEPIVFIVISSAHRKEAFTALERAIYRYKHDSPVWKKEVYDDGSGRWITTAK